MTETSTAAVGTDRPGRYAKQLVSHMSRKAEAVWNDDTSTGSVTFSNAHLDLSTADDALLLSLSAEPDALDSMEDVVGRHLVRFGTRDELIVQWQRGDGGAGTMQRKTGN